MKCLFASLAALAASGAYACEPAEMVNMPDGNTATLSQMVAAQKTVKAYEAAMNDYLACIDKDLKAAGPDAPDEFKGLMANRHNAAVTEMEAVADAFNHQVRAFKGEPDPAPESEPSVAQTETAPSTDYKAYCAQQWPTNYQMQAYCLDQQVDGMQKTNDFLGRYNLSVYTVQQAAQGGNPAGIIYKQCAADWLPNYEMLAYCVEQQEKAAVRLGKL